MKSRAYHLVYFRKKIANVNLIQNDAIAVKTYRELVRWKRNHIITFICPESDKVDLNDPDIEWSLVAKHLLKVSVAI